VYGKTATGRAVLATAPLKTICVDFLSYDRLDNIIINVNKRVYYEKTTNVSKR